MTFYERIKSQILNLLYLFTIMILTNLNLPEDDFKQVSAFLAKCFMRKKNCKCQKVSNNFSLPEVKNLKRHTDGRETKCFQKAHSSIQIKLAKSKTLFVCNIKDFCHNAFSSFDISMIVKFKFNCQCNCLYICT